MSVVGTFMQIMQVLRQEQHSAEQSRQLEAIHEQMAENTQAINRISDQLSAQKSSSHFQQNGQTHVTQRSTVAGTETYAELHELAQTGDPEYQVRLGIAYAEGDGDVPRSDKRAFLLFKAAAEQGHAGAQVALGSMYFEGLGISHNVNKALFWYHRSAAQGNELAKSTINLLELQGYR